MNEENLTLTDEDERKAQQFINKIKGNNLFIYIDDTSHKEFNNDLLDNNIKSYVGVLFEQDQRKTILNILTPLKFALKDDGKTEFHFVDIYNRQGEWEGIEPSDVMSIFDLFSKIMLNQDIPFFIQSSTKENYEKLTQLLNNEKIKQHLREEKLTNINAEFANIVFLLKQINDYLEENKIKYDNIYVTIDEGLLKANSSIRFNSNLFKNVCDNYFIDFEKSSSDTLLQIADFVAYSFSRLQYLNKKALEKQEDFFKDEFYSSIYTSISDILSQCLSPSLICTPLDLSKKNQKKSLKQDNSL